ncbi:helix-turn-helix transcriptional regulator [Amycolatopsis sp. FDAARGOS 1241]|uniref:helix-turn-helix transcriptional regulator n=1 Tax=Amycolatopsis sp. FDAARGOS 1241 TaxID=2778070 RepID=UPI00194F5B28|nr:AraC family transcriptional regulator [Amycolatopsis sp. FDAARGOS 1241]QRP46430.1 helix-turn-helix transcriptional regulator [Amycolatopsis sp. FDAARGOS 1241]
MDVAIAGSSPVSAADARLAQLRQVRLAKDMMDRHWAEPIDVAAVAARAGYSRYHFIRAFRAVYGQTLGQYLSRRRIERAEDLLRTADLSVTEICVLVGFSSLGTFSSSFKKYSGFTPTEYRARHVGAGAALVPGCYALLWHGGFKAFGSGAGRRAGDNRNS